MTLGELIQKIKQKRKNFKYHCSVNDADEKATGMSFIVVDSQ